MASAIKVLLLVVLVCALLAVNVSASNSRPPRNNDISNMADALKYLQDLDTYYGDRARVRFGKRTPLIQVLRSRFMENPDAARSLELSPAEEPF